MLNLLIVEDEYMTRSELQYEFDWGSVGFFVCGAVRDGIDALEYLNTTPVDVVLTDISMPRMDGLELIEQIRLLKLPIRCVILSGYDNFEFAQKAIQCGVSHYLLKPLHDEDLYALFIKLRNEITSERQQSESIFRLHQMIKESQNNQAVNVMRNYLTSKNSDVEAVYDLLQNSDYVSTGDVFFLFLIDDSHSPSSDLESCSDAFYIETFHRKPINFRYHSVSIVFLAVQAADQGKLPGCMESLCVEKNLRAFFSGPYQNLTELPSVFQRLILQEKNLFYLELGRLYSSLEFTDLTSAVSEMNISDFYEEFSRLIKAGLESELCMALHRFKRFFLQNMPAHDYAVVAFTESYLKVTEKLKNASSTVEALPFKDIYKILASCSSFFNMVQLFSEQILALNYSFHNPQKTSPSLIDELKVYIVDHYNEDLSLTALAARFYFHPNYLSTFFLKKVGMPLPKYIRMVRLNKSQELLASTRQSVADIAKAVGFSDYRYFCNSFKQEFQQTPLEYRASSHISKIRKTH